LNNIICKQNELFLNLSFELKNVLKNNNFCLPVYARIINVTITFASEYFAQCLCGWTGANI